MISRSTDFQQLRQAQDSHFHSKVFSLVLHAKFCKLLAEMICGAFFPLFVSIPNFNFELKFENIGPVI